jgi:hypothetical protein
MSQRTPIIYCPLCGGGLRLEPEEFLIEWTPAGTWSNFGRESIICTWEGCEKRFFVLFNRVYLPGYKYFGPVREHPDMYADN